MTQVKFSSYIWGFILSLIATLLAYILTINHLLSRSWAIGLVIAVLALSQFFTQLILFLHLGQESKPKFKLLIFGFMALVVIILVAGSVWIMNNLNYRMMNNSTSVNKYLNSSNGL